MNNGRFAPTPSGPLHQGSLVTAVASYCEAKSQQGKWLIRIEDLDTPRIVKGSADNILYTLEAFGFEWDDEVLYQSQRFAAYQETIQLLIRQELIYACSCSRKSLLQQQANTGPLGIIYPGICRKKKLPLNAAYNLRLNLQHAGEYQFIDRHYGTFGLNLGTQIGDIIIKRLDGVFAYHLAVVMDDHLQQVKHIVRGADLLEVTPLHLYLNSLLGFQDASYLHLPLIRAADGQKLSKQTGAKALDSRRISEHLYAALRFLGQPISEKMVAEAPTEILSYAVDHWDAGLIPV